MEILNKEVKTIAQKKLEEEMTGQVKILLFTQEPSRLIVLNKTQGQECLYCRETRQLLEEIKALSDKIELKVYDFVADKEIADAYGIAHIPATIIMGEKDFGIRFFGIPSGYEFTTLLEDIIDVSRGTNGLSPATKGALKVLDHDVRIQVFVTPTCPYCTSAVRLAHQMAMESDKIRAEMIESTEFPHLAQKYAVYGVPKTVMNDTVTLEGAVPEDVFLQHVLKAAGQQKA